MQDSHNLHACLADCKCKVSAPSLLLLACCLKATVATFRYGMLDPSNKDSNNLPLTIRAVFIIGPDKKLKLSLNYPASVGRNMEEIMRCVDALQLSAKHSVVSLLLLSSSLSSSCVPLLRVNLLLLLGFCNAVSDSSAS